MGITNPASGTRIDEIADGIHRLSTPIPPSASPGGFTFNQVRIQFLIAQFLITQFLIAQFLIAQFLIAQFLIAQFLIAQFLIAQFLIADDEPLRFHTGLRGLFPLVAEASAAVLPLARLRHIACSRVEADACGALNDVLAAAPLTRALLDKLAALAPTTLVWMHGSSWRGAGAALLRRLADRVG